MHVSINAQYKVSAPYIHIQIPLEGKVINRNYGAAYDFELGDSAVLTELAGKPTDASSLATDKPYTTCKLDVFSDAICIVKDGVKVKLPAEKGAMVAEELINNLSLKVTKYESKAKAKAPAAKGKKAPAKKAAPKKAAKSTAKKPASKAPAKKKGGKK